MENISKSKKRNFSWHIATLAGIAVNLHISSIA
ncbi:MAG: hypothetical protein ACI9UU_002953, partial [Candidatus Azotimanducaceae bacterium]